MLTSSLYLLPIFTSSAGIPGNDNTPSSVTSFMSPDSLESSVPSSKATLTFDVWKSTSSASLLYINAALVAPTELPSTINNPTASTIRGFLTIFFISHLPPRLS